MDPRRILLTLRLDLAAAVRRSLAGGPARLAATLGGGLTLVVAELWVTSRVTLRLQQLPPPLQPLAAASVHRLEALVLQLAAAVAVASAASTALAVLHGLETDPFEAATPRPGVERGLAGWWRTAASLAWLALLAGPPLALLGTVGAGPWRSLAALSIVLGIAAAAGTALSLLLAALVPRRILVPAAWTATTAAVVGAVLWLRSLHPERLAAAADPTAMLRLLAVLGGKGTGPLPRLLSAGGLLPGAAVAAAAVVASALVWALLGRRAGEHLASGDRPDGGSSPMWSAADALLTRFPAGALLAARLRLLARDTLQSSQLLYLVGLGAVYVMNLKSLPLDAPLARELAGLVNLAMAGLLAAALALRFAYPARLLGGPSWWWATAPVHPLAADLALTAGAAVPILALSGGLYLAAAGATGESAQGLALVLWLGLWLAAAGVLTGPRATDQGPRWIDAALGGGGLFFLGLSFLAVAWCTAAAGAPVIAEVAQGLGLAWVPPAPLAAPAIPVSVLTVLLLVRAAVPRR